MIAERWSAQTLIRFSTSSSFVLSTERTFSFPSGITVRYRGYFPVTVTLESS